MIKAEHLYKYYGDHMAVQDLSFEIGEGHVYGFLGPNGAGKSTTMNMMTGCLSQSGGSIQIDGYDVFEEPKRAKRMIGYLPEQPPLYLNESPEEYLRFVGEAKGLSGAKLREDIHAVMEQTGILAVRKRRLSSLSKGYRQRVGIAQALLGDPKVIILDEPTVGLDPIQIVEIRALIRELGKKHTVIFSSHILAEVQEICDRVLIINRGRLLAFDTPENLERSLAQTAEIRIVTELDADAACALLGKIADVTEIRAQQEKAEQTENTEAAQKRTQLSLRTRQRDPYETTRAIFEAFAACKEPLLELSVKKTNLEDIFLELTENTGTESPESADTDKKPTAREHGNAKETVRMGAENAPAEHAGKKRPDAEQTEAANADGENTDAADRSGAAESEAKQQ